MLVRVSPKRGGRTGLSLLGQPNRAPKHFRKPQIPSPAFPQYVVDREVEDRPVEKTVVRREVQRDWNVVRANLRQCAQIEIVSAIVERHGYGARRQRAFLQSLQRVAQLQQRAAMSAEIREPLAETLTPHVQRGIPFVLITETDAVIAEDQQALPTPFAFEQEL